MEAPVPPDEQQRRLALERYRVLDTVGEQAFDDLTLLASHICRTPIAALTFIDADRQWIKSKIGVEVRELPRDVAFCSHTIARPETLVVEDATRDARFAANPLVTGEPRIRFYAGAPLVTPEGHAIGALCVLDREARGLDPAQEEALRALARQAMAQLEMRRLVSVMHRGAAQREQAEEALRRERDFTNAVMETAGALVVVVDREGLITRFNDACERVTGWTFDEVRARPFWEALLPEEDVAAARRVFERLRAGDFPAEHENHWLTRAGERRLIRWSNTALTGDGGRVEHVIGTGIDITEQRRALERLRASEARYKYLVDHADDIIYRTDAYGRFTFVNPSATRLLGFPEAELLGRRFVELIDGDARADVDRFYRTQFAERTANTYHEFPVRTNAGELRWIGQNVQFVIDGEQITGFQAVARDITERRRAAERMERLTLTDDLTKLYNSRALGSFAEEFMRLAARSGDSVIAVYADMDGLKSINDRFGHDEGSRAIKAAATILRASFRDSDVVVRLGGDEFVVLGVAARQSTDEQITARLRRNLAFYNETRQHDYELSLSIGVARRAPDDAGSIDDLLRAADAAMYEQKRSRGAAR